MATEPQPRSFKLGYNTLTWHDSYPDLERVFATIKQAGWEGVELMNIDANWSGPPSRVRRMLERVGLPAIAMLGIVQIDDERRARVLEEQKRMIDFGAELGCEAYVFIGGDRVERRLPTDDEFKLLAEASSDLIAYAEPLGMSVNHHSHPRCTCERESEQDRLLELADARLRVCLDVAISAFMDEDPVVQIHKYGERIGYVHLKDWAHGKYCVLGEGTKGIDWPAVMNAFEAAGFDGWVTTELSAYADTDADASCLSRASIQTASSSFPTWTRYGRLSTTRRALSIDCARPSRAGTSAVSRTTSATRTTAGSRATRAWLSSSSQRTTISSHRLPAAPPGGPTFVAWPRPSRRYRSSSITRAWLAPSMGSIRPA
jgi:inosose dehydratase